MREQEIMQNEANKWGIHETKKYIVTKIYRTLKAEGIEDAAIQNERYLVVNGRTYQTIKSKKQNTWIIREI